MHSKSDCRLLRRVVADMFIVFTAAGAKGGEVEGRRRTRFSTPEFSQDSSLYGGQTDGNAGIRATASTNPTTSQVPKHTQTYIHAHINAKSPYICKEAIFPSAFTKPCFQCNHLSSIRTCCLCSFFGGYTAILG